MRYLGSQPGGLLFRAIAATLLILIIIVQFLGYVDEVQISTENASVDQTIRVVDSGMVVYFSKMVINKQLDKIADMDGANPFPLLATYNLVPAEYQGEIEGLVEIKGRAGWYYFADSGEVIYRYRYQDKTEKFRLTLKYQDYNGDDQYQVGQDHLVALHLNRLAQ